MHVVALVEAEDHVCCRYRVAAFRPHVEKAGHVFTVHALPRGTLARLRLFRRTRSADVVILQRKLLCAAEFFILRRSARKLIFDFDDAIWLRDSYSIKGFESRRRASRFRRIVKQADCVVAGNSILADEARRWTEASRAEVIPTCVDPARYPTSEHATRPNPLTLVWVGSSSTLRGLERNRDMFEAIGRSVPNVRLRVVCDRFPLFDHLPVEPVVWSEEAEAEVISTADVGVGWVPDDPWSRGKCGLKILQYQAAGLPVVANPVGVQADMVKHEKTGLLAGSMSEWVSAIESLAASAELRSRLGRAGRAQVESSYSVDVGGAKWLQILAGMTDRGGRPSC